MAPEMERIKDELQTVVDRKEINMALAIVRQRLKSRTERFNQQLGKNLTGGQMTARAAIKQAIGHALS